jgi:phage-related protein (TIGR01555 family)
MDVSPRALADGIANLFSRLGTSADRNTRSFYYTPTVTQDQAEHGYRSSWLTRKVHDLPPFEMTRAGRDWQAEADQIRLLEETEQRIGLWDKLRRATRTARLHGGSAIVLGVRQGMPDQPLIVDQVRKGALRYAVVVSRHQLTAPQGFDYDPESDFFNTPQMWEMRMARGSPLRIHPSRVLTFHGSSLPEGAVTCDRLEQFWGDPLLTSLKSAIDNSETSQAAVATLLHELKTDTIHIPGLTAQIATEGHETLLASRIQAVATLKSMFNVLFLDGGDKNGHGKEEWNTRELSFTQHPELLRVFLGIVAGASDIPVTRLMGESPGGLQSTGKGEEADFNRMIDARRQAELAPPLLRADEILIRSALGTRPPEIRYEFGALDDGNAAEESEIEKREAETVQIYATSGVVPVDVLRTVTQNRLMESDRWPGMDQAIADHEAALAAGEVDENGDDPEAAAAALEAQAANENDVQSLAKSGAVTRDQALLLLADASPRSLYVKRDLLNGAEFIAWAKSQGFGDLVPADSLHVTIINSRSPVDWMKAGSEWSENENGELVVRPGGARIVETLGSDGAPVLMFSSSVLSWRNEALQRETGARDKFPNYQPHVTISYAPLVGVDLSNVEPFRGELRFGPEIFEEVVENWRPATADA